MNEDNQAGKLTACIADDIVGAKEAMALLSIDPSMRKAAPVLAALLRIVEDLNHRVESVEHAIFLRTPCEGCAGLSVSQALDEADGGQVKPVPQTQDTAEGGQVEQQ